MKRKIMIVAVVFLMTDFLIQQASAIGISPARTTRDLLEYNCAFNSSIGYTLTRPSSARYSMFSVYDAAGMNGTITGCSASNSFEYIDNKNILIDWQSNELLSVSTTTAAINIQSPQSWNCPAVPGEGSYMADLVRHSEVVNVGSGISVGVAAVSQISLWRNYAPKAYALNYQDSITHGQSANFVFQFADKQTSWVSSYIDRNSNGGPWLSYSIDWEGDGVADITGSGIFDEDPIPYPKFPVFWMWTSGIQLSTISLDHIYASSGDYTATVKVWDSIESTTLEIPIHVVPEPATLLLFGLGGLFLRKYKS
jgi:hypothetical protein